MIRLEHIRKEYPGVVPLADVSAEIRDGDVISVIGPSGTGKSTLLRCINMLETPTSGSIWLDDTEITAPGCDLSKVRQKMGMVFQSFHLFSHLSVIENLMLAPIDLLGQSRQEAYDKGLELLKTVGLGDKAKSYPDQLSGGQKQRVAIARTLAMGPEIILFDEPTSALDPAMVGEVQAVIRELSRSPSAIGSSTWTRAASMRRGRRNRSFRIRCGRGHAASSGACRFWSWSLTAGIMTLLRWKAGSGSTAVSSI